AAEEGDTLLGGLLLLGEDADDPPALDEDVIPLALEELPQVVAVRRQLLHEDLLAPDRRRIEGPPVHGLRVGPAASGGGGLGGLDRFPGHRRPPPAGTS